MKKILLLFLPCMFLLAGSAKAQLQKGTVHWGATISADGNGTHSDNDAYSPYKQNNHNIAPSLQMGWMVKDNRMFGLQLTSYFALRKVKSNLADDYEYTDNYSSLGLSPFIRQYKSINSKLAIFLQSGVDGAYSWSKRKESGALSKSENGFGAGLHIHPGIAYWVTPRFAIESDLQLLSLRAGYTDFADSKGFSFRAGITSSVGNYFGIRAAWYLQKSN